MKKYYTIFLMTFFFLGLSQVFADDPETVNITVQPVETIAGGPIEGPPTVEVLDDADQPVENVTVTVTLDNGSAFDDGETTLQTDSDGLAEFGDLIIETAGTYNLVFTVDGVSPDKMSVDFDVIASVPDEMVIFEQPSDTKAGDVIGSSSSPPRVRVRVDDEYGNAVTGIAVNVSLDNGSGFDEGETIQTTNINGAAIFNNLVINTAGEYNMVFSLVDETQGVDDVTSQSFSIFSAEAVDFSITVEDVTAGEEADIHITDAVDEFGNDLDGEYNVSVAITVNDYDNDEDLSFESGMAIYTTDGLTKDAGMYTVEVEIDEIEENTSFEIVHSDVVGQIEVEVADITAGDNAVLDITIEDEHGNSMSGEYETTIDIGNATTVYTAGLFVSYEDGVAEYETTEALVAAGALEATVSIGVENGADTFEVFPTEEYDLTQSTVIADPDIADADDVDEVTIIITLKDEYGNQLAEGGEEIRVEESGSLTEADDHNDGTYSADISSKLAGTREVTAYINEFPSWVPVGTTTVTFLPLEADADESEISADPVDGLVADGEDASTITVVLRDKYGNRLLDGGTAAVTLTSDPDDHTEISEPVDLEDGNYMATLTSTTSGEVTVTANLESNPGSEEIGTVSVIFLSGLPVVENSNLGVDPAELVADGEAEAIITMTVEDKNENPVEFVNVLFEITDGDAHLSEGPWVTNEDGEAIATLTSTVANDVTVSGYLDKDSEWAYVEEIEVTFTPGTPDPEISEIKAEPLNVFADGTDQSTITITLKDASGNLVPEKYVFFDIAEGTATLTDASLKTDSEGKATSEIHSTTPGEVVINGYIGEDDQGPKVGSVTVTFENKNIIVDADPQEITADGTDSSLITVTVESLGGGAVENVSVTVTTDRGEFGNNDQSKVVDTDDNGVATLTLTSTEAGIANIVATRPATAPGNTQVTLNPGSASEFTVAVDDIFRTEEAMIHIENAEDTFGNMLQGEYTGNIHINNAGEEPYTATVTFKFTDGESEYQTDGLIDIPGEYTVEVTIDGVIESDDFKILQPELEFALNGDLTQAGEEVFVESGHDLTMTLEDIILGKAPFTIDVVIYDEANVEYVSFDDAEVEEIGDEVFAEDLPSGIYSVSVESITDHNGIPVLNPEDIYYYQVDVGHIITASSTIGGSIDPEGEVQVTHGNNQMFTFDADDGYDLIAVILDEDEDLGEISSYTFPNVTKNHTIDAEFELRTYEIEVSANDDDFGTVSGTGTYDHGATVTVTATPKEGYFFEEWLENDDPVMDGDDPAGATYTFTAVEDRDLVAHFEIFTYNITAIANPDIGGTVTGTGTYDHFEDVTLTATPETGYHFVNWTENGDVVMDGDEPAEETYTFVAEEPRDLEANFKINTYDITALVEPKDAGDLTSEVSGDGMADHGQTLTLTVDHGKTVTLTATAKVGYQFDNWKGTDPLDDVEEQIISFEATEDRDFTARFSLKTYTITVTAVPEEGGNVDGDGEYEHFDLVELEADPNDNYDFTGWYEGNDLLSLNKKLEFTATEDRDLEARFAKDQVTIGAEAVPPGMGTVTGTGTFDVGDIVTLTATPSQIDGLDAHHFKHWTEGGEILEENGETIGEVYAFEAIENRYLLAHFAINVYSIDVDIEPEAGGTVSGEGDYEHGDEVTLLASPNENFLFTHWTENGDTIMTDDAEPVPMGNEYDFDAIEDREITAHFTEDIHTVTVTVKPEGSGSVTVEEFYYSGEDVTLVAVPEEGYHFDKWTEGGETIMVGDDPAGATYTFTIEEDRDLVAHFAINTYTINVTAEPEEGGNVNVDSEVLEHGEELTLFASPVSSYTFVGWYDAEDLETPLSNNQLYTHTATQHIDIVALFTQDTYLIEADVEPEGAGTVTGTGTYGHGAQVELEALPNPGYLFTYWKEDGVTIQPGGTTYTFTATQDRYLTAHFELEEYEITADVDPPAGGTVTGTGTFTYGEMVTMEATANDGHDFAGWYEGDVLLSDDLVYEFEVEGDRHLTAKFDVHIHTIDGEPVPFAGGTIDGKGDYDYGSVVTMTATPNTGYHFLYWTHQGNVLSEDEVFEFAITQSKYILAHFALNVYAIDAQAEPEEGGEILGAGNYTHGEEVTLEAVPNTGYSFVNWTENEESIIIGENGPVTETYTFTAQSDRNLTAHFEIFEYEITAEANPEIGGTVTGTGTFKHGEEVTLEAIPETGYEFVEWTVGEVTVSTDMTYVFPAEEALHLTAHFELKTYVITAIADPEDGGTIEGAGAYQHGETVTLEALPADGFEFVEWTDGNGWSHAYSELTFTAEEDLDLVAHFALKVYTIDAMADPEDGGQVMGAGDYTHGEEVTLEAIPESGYYFLEWTEDDAHVSDQEVYVFDAEADRSLTAHFEKFSYEISASVDPVGAGIVSGTGTYEHGDDVTLIATSESAYHFTDWTEDDVVVGTDSVLTFTAEDHRDLVANFEVNIYTIQATSSQGGSINPEGDIEVVHGDNQNFTFDADEGYHLEDVFVDGSSIGAEPFYLFLNVTKDHTIHADFVLNTYTLIYDTDGNGTLTGNTEQQVDHGSDGTPVEAIPNTGYHFTQWSDGVTDNPRTDENVSGDIHVTAEFALNTYTLAYDTDGNGTISGDATQTVEHGSDGSPVEAIPNTGYHFTEWSDGVTDNPRTDENVTEDLSVTAHFALNVYTIEASAGDNGSITPAGDVEVTHGDDQSFTITPDDGYEVHELIIDGNAVDPAEEYVFEDVDQNHSIHAEFTLTHHMITATSTEGGSIDPEGDVEVTHGTNQTFHFEADTGYHLEDVLVDDASVGSESSFTFNNVTKSHTIHAIFSINVYTLEYIAGENGSLEGDTGQHVEHGSDGTPVEAIPNDGYHFVQWSDGVTDNPRIDADVDSDIHVTAEFALTTYDLTFEVEDEFGEPITDAQITLNEHTHDPGEYHFADLEPGMYQFVVSRDGYFDAEGTVEITDHDVTMDVVMLIDDTHVPDTKPLEVRAFPNPVAEMLTIDAGSRIESVRLVDLTGSVVYNAAVNDNYHVINVSRFEPGIYILQVTKERGGKTMQIQVRN